MSEQESDIFDLDQIWNCQHAFAKSCPKSWHSLRRTDKSGVRHCQECNLDVTYCDTPEKFVKLGNAGQCVAIPDGRAPYGLQMELIGRPSPEHVSELKQKQAKTAGWWKEVLEHGPNFQSKVMNEVMEAVKFHEKRDVIQACFEEMIQGSGEIKNKGPEEFLRNMQQSPNGMKLSEQQVYKMMVHLFDLNYKEFKSLQRRIAREEKDSPENE